MIAMHVTDENASESLKPQSFPSQSHLHSFPRIDQIGMAVDVYKLRGGSSGLGRHCCPRTQKNHLKIHSF
jgi:hypothetical protein